MVTGAGGALTGEQTRERGPGQTQMAPGEAGARLPVQGRGESRRGWSLVSFPGSGEKRELGNETEEQPRGDQKAQHRREESHQVSSWGRDRAGWEGTAGWGWTVLAPTALGERGAGAWGRLRPRTGTGEGGCGVPKSGLTLDCMT